MNFTFQTLFVIVHKEKWYQQKKEATICGRVEIAKRAKTNMTTTAINGNIGDTFVNFKDFQHALGIAFYSLGDFRKAIEYHERHHKISKEGGDRAGGGKAYGNLGNAYHTLGDFQKAIEYHERNLKISTEVGDKAGEGIAYVNLGNAYHRLEDFQKAVPCYKNSVRAFDHIRRNLICNDEWKITLKSSYDHINLRLWELQFKEGKVIEALLTADQGRAQALNDLEFNYGLKGLRP